MTASQIYRRLRDNGDVAVAVSLSTCLAWRYGAFGFLAAFLFLVLISSRLSSIPDSIRASSSAFFRTNRGLYYGTKFAYTACLFILLLYHADGLSEMETPLKCLLAAYILALNIDRFRWKVLVYGVAIGAIVAAVFGAIEIGSGLVARMGGSTNPIRFGMVAMAFAAVSAVGFLHARDDRRLASVAAAGSLCGLGAAFMSGSRGALLALPVLLLLLAPIVWRRSRRIFLTASAFLVVFAGILLSSNIGFMKTRLVAAYTNVVEMIDGGPMAARGSVGDRTKLLVLSYRLFREQPLVGVGLRGWNNAVAELVRAPDPNDRVKLPYNQAHNQYADDLAKGGIVRFLLGFLMLFLPLYLFLKCEPFSERPGSEFALAGIMVSVGFMIFCLSESLMILSLTASVHTSLMLYLLAGCDAARRTSQAAVSRSGERPVGVAGERVTSAA